jgi:osmoprotectant transport system permease protein
MGLLGEALDFLTAPQNWDGIEGIPNRVWEHVQISALGTLLGALVALPAGLYVGHTRRLQFLAVTAGNLGRALPSFGILALVFPFTLRYDFFPGDIGFSATVIAMFLLAIPPILLNTYVGVQSIDPDEIEAGRGMGLSERQILFEIEVPLAAPLIVVGLRNAAVSVVATATLAALVGWGGLGRFIIDGFAQGDEAQLLGGGILVALLAIVTEVTFGFVERAISPSGVGRKSQPVFRSAGQVPRSDVGVV